tara:strand:- start:43 stop:543 length:501 start_codon:yes stop_codon:yes gene_type:complete
MSKKVRVRTPEMERIHNLQACASRCIRSAYFATGHPSTAVEGALATWLEEVEELLPNFERPSWAKKITDCEPLFAPTGGYSSVHTLALYQVAGFKNQIYGGFSISSEIHAMILAISVKGAASDYAWVAFQDGDAIAWIETCTRMLTLLHGQPQLITGIDPFSECGP